MIQIQKLQSASVPDTHYHNGFELLCVYAGSVCVQVAGHSYAVQAPACVFFSNLEPHALTQASKHYERYTLLISPQEAATAIKSPLLLSAFRNRPKDFSHVLPCDAQPLLRILEMMQQETQRADGFSGDCLQHLFYQLLVALYRQSPAFFPLNNHACSDSLLAVQQYLDEHFQENLSIQEVAQHFFISPGYLQHRFTELVGCSPKQYLILSRLSAAQRLLLTSRLTVSQIAAECGFKDVNNFIRRFSAHYHATPAQYRKSQQNDERNRSG